MGLAARVKLVSFPIPVFRKPARIGHDHRPLKRCAIPPIEFQRTFRAVITTEQYVASIVEKYRVVPDSNSTSHRAAKVIPVLQRWGKEHLEGITLSGAYAKNTAITLSSDVDVLVSLSPVADMDMKTIFWNLFKYLSDQDLHPHRRDVSVRLRSGEFNVDVIPACCEGESSGNALLNLFNKRPGRVVHTDVTRHIHLVANSGRQQEICALKIWRERMALDFPSFYLESTVLHALVASALDSWRTMCWRCCAIFRIASSRPWSPTRRMRVIFSPTIFLQATRKRLPLLRATRSMRRTGRRCCGRWVPFGLARVQ